MATGQVEHCYAFFAGERLSPSGRERVPPVISCRIRPYRATARSASFCRTGSRLCALHLGPGLLAFRGVFDGRSPPREPFLRFDAVQPQQAAQLIQFLRGEALRTFLQLFQRLEVGVVFLHLVKHPSELAIQVLDDRLQSIRTPGRATLERHESLQLLADGGVARSRADKAEEARSARWSSRSRLRNSGRCRKRMSLSTFRASLRTA